jgi:hypothetical protein
MRSPYLRVSSKGGWRGDRAGDTDTGNDRGRRQTTASADRGVYEDVKLGVFGESGNFRRPTLIVKITDLGGMERMNRDFSRHGQLS